MYGLMKYQDETVSTLVCMCKYIDLYVYNTQHATSTLELETWSSCRPKCSSSNLSKNAQGNVLESQHQKPRKIHRCHFSGRSQQRDCVCQQLCTNRPLMHLCDHYSSHLSVSHRHQLQLSSVSVCCTEHLAQILTSHHEWPSLGSLALPRLVRHLAQDRKLFQLSTPHHRFVHPSSSPVT